MGIQLKKAGIHNFTIYEKAATLGGTWRDNSYPGCGCDVPSYLYSFSFEQKHDWSHRFSGQSEILAYLERCVDKYGLKPHISFRSEITCARFIAREGLWQIESARGDTLLANVLVSACGQLNRPCYPDIPGLDRFRGACFHSARWDHDHDLRGKRVAVIGSGASAVQFIPEIAPDVAQLSVFQRTPNWMIRRLDHAYSHTRHRLFRWLPILKHLYRWLIYLQLESRWPAFSLGARLGARLERGVAAEMGARVADTGLRKRLIPEYPIGAKRILVSDDYLEAVRAENVEVVSSPIERVTSSRVVTADGRSRPADTIILATGFEATRFLAPMEIVGKDGRTLEACWRAGAQAYLGLAVAGFPNFFMCYGPNTNLGHNSIVFMVECQVRYILRCIEALGRRRLRYLDVREEAVAAFNRSLQKDMARRVWNAQCSSWYKTDAGTITNNWAYSSIYYWWKTLQPDFSSFLQVGADEVDADAACIDLVPMSAKPPLPAKPAEAEVA